MQACLENPVLPLLEPGSLPLLESVPTWTIRVARPATLDRKELAEELRGVPKLALRQVFGQSLGTRLWQQNRAASTSAKPAPSAAISPLAPTSDAEISSGLLRYLCTEAAATLRERKRIAKAISLTVLYPDGESEIVRERLLQPANDATSLETAARMALRGTRSDAFVSLKLDLIATPEQA